MNTSPAFARTIGIDYSGAETPTASLKGLRVYLAEGDAPPVEVPPPQSSRKYWSRKGIAQWLVERLAEDARTLVGIDHGFSFPLSYFEVATIAAALCRLPFLSSCLPTALPERFVYQRCYVAHCAG
jgi:hypothetical protein